MSNFYVIVFVFESYVGLEVMLNLGLGLHELNRAVNLVSLCNFHTYKGINLAACLWLPCYVKSENKSHHIVLRPQ